jgi:hypothetical protein
MENMRRTTPSRHAIQPGITDDLAHVMDSQVIAYENISESFGISLDGIETIVELLHQSLPGLLITNGHIVAVLMGELASSPTADDAKMSPRGSSSMEQKIDQVAQAYYWDYIWELLESLAHCLRMVEVAYTNKLKKQSPRSQREFLEQVVNAVRPACKLSQWGYPEATQMLFRRLAELGVTAEQALDLTLEDDRSSLSPFTTERSLLEKKDN